MADALRTWGTSLRQTWRLLPEAGPAVRVLLSSNGATPAEIKSRLPYEAARAGDAAGVAPGVKRDRDERRYRDERFVLQTVGLVYEQDGHLVVTEFGRTVLRWLDLLHGGNAPVLGRHAALALAACQLRNPTGAGSKYDSSMFVFPFAFIWRAMLSLDDRLSSAELLRAVLKVRNHHELDDAIKRIAGARRSGDIGSLGAPISNLNDRAIPWMGLASFGWVLIRDKSNYPSGDYYTINPAARSAIARAASLPLLHRDFQSPQEYAEHISASAVLPPVLA